MKYEEPKMDVRILLKGKVVTTSGMNTGNVNKPGEDEGEDWSDDWN